MPVTQVYLIFLSPSFVKLFKKFFVVHFYPLFWVWWSTINELETKGNIIQTKVKLNHNIFIISSLSAKGFSTNRLNDHLPSG